MDFLACTSFLLFFRPFSIFVGPLRSPGNISNENKRFLIFNVDSLAFFEGEIASMKRRKANAKLNSSAR